MDVETMENERMKDDSENPNVRNIYTNDPMCKDLIEKMSKPKRYYVNLS